MAVFFGWFGVVNGLFVVVLLVVGLMVLVGCVCLVVGGFVDMMVTVLGANVIVVYIDDGDMIDVCIGGVVERVCFVGIDILEMKKFGTLI